MARSPAPTRMVERYVAVVVAAAFASSACSRESGNLTAPANAARLSGQQLAATAASTIITFDAPGAGMGPGQGTMPVGIVQGEWVMGNYIDANGVYHGFLRAPDGRFTEFDVPGAGKGAGQGAVEVHGMNPAREIVGTILDANNVYHGFLRTPDGKFTTFDCPGAGKGMYHGTASHSVNPAGLILAEYLDANNVWHGCLRARDGTFTTFDPPDIGTGYYQGTFPAIFAGINPEGASVGEYADANNVFHAYLRAPDGTITEFSDPNAGGGYTGSIGINPAGEIWGVYFDANSVFHGFLRSPNGHLTEVDVPGAGTGTCQGTNAACVLASFGAITPAGTVTGVYADGSNVYHGFLRTPHGEFVTFSAPGAGRGDWQGTEATAINPEGATTGWYIDANNVYHGFLRMP